MTRPIPPHARQVEPIDLPDHDAQLIETTGVEILERKSMPPAVAENAPRIVSNDNASLCEKTAKKSGKLVPFAATLPRLG